MAIGLKKIEWGIYLLLFSLPLYTIRPSLGFFHTTIVELLFFVVLIWWLVINYGQLRAIGGHFVMRARQSPIFSLVITLVLLSATIGIFVAPDKLAALGVWRAYFIEPFIFSLICLSVLDTPLKVRRALWALLLSGVCIAIFAIIQKFTGFHIPLPWLEERRATSIYPYPNAVGLYLAPIIAMALPFARYYYIQKTRKEIGKSIAVVSMVILMCVAIVFAKTEAALVALAVVGLGYGLLCAGKRVRYASILASVFVGIIIAVSPMVHNTLSEKLLLRDWSGFVRQTTWKESYTMLSDHWMVGAGLSGYQSTMAPYHKATYLEIFMYPHTILLNIWSELGALGLVAFVLFVLWCVGAVLHIGRRIYKDATVMDVSWHRTVLIACVMVGLVMLIHGLVDVPYFKNDLAMLTWFFLALFVSLQKSVTIKHNI